VLGDVSYLYLSKNFPPDISIILCNQKAKLNPYRMKLTDRFLEFLEKGDKIRELIIRIEAARVG
jgi:hypothetical protein